jgi:2-oxoglutarate dehydrogenase E1 component
MERMWRSGHISAGNASYVEELYEKYLEDPADIPDQWRSYFETLPMVEGAMAPDISHATVRDHFLLLSKNQARVVPVSASSINAEHERKQFAVSELISGYRRRGHLKANLDPLGIQERVDAPRLELEYHKLSAADLDTKFQTGDLFFGQREASLIDIVAVLESTYCGSIGAEYMHISDETEQMWVQQRMESARSQPSFSNGVKRRILDRLIAAEGLEKYLGTRYPGTKRFGLEGAESFIPCLAELIHRAGSSGVVETVIGMAHRGRINVLVNLMGKDPADLFDEFEGRYEPGFGSGDVKYHQGFSSNVITPGGEMHLALGFNPSHLEIAAPVIVGSVRARMDRRKDVVGDKVLAINVHGDAAFAGQGVVMETFQMSQTRGYYTGGTIHVVINNQIGYTVSEQVDARTSHYCTDVAKMVQAPVFHVNGDDPEAVVFVSQLAVDYRMEFKKDVVIDMVCYRRRGHNEGDEPSITQPIMYEKIRKHPTTLTLHAEKIIAEGALDANEYQSRIEAYRDSLDEGKAVAWDFLTEPDVSLHVDWTPFLGHDWDIPSDTTCELKRFQDIAHRLHEIPEGFVLQKQVGKIIEDRRKMAAGAMAINWGFGEIMAYGTLVDQGYSIRLTGQDVGRGTFSHRHAVLHDQKAGGTLTPLAGLEGDDNRFYLYDSLLSEEAVLGFEYGYSGTSPNTLVIWEAQFGDFANGAQVVIDQFITSGEHKWARLSGLTMLLPHGYEGAGPEHSSARLERYLQLSAEHNIQVCVPTTPAQMYHLVRRQAIRPLRKPLIVMTPKSLLRHKEASSTLEDLVVGSFKNIIGDETVTNSQAVDRIVFCSGKVYYDLNAKRIEDKLENVAIARIEQLYPFPELDMKSTINSYPNIKQAVWCQEEPMNQGAWYSSQHHLRRVLHKEIPELYLAYAGREASAAAAVGYMSLHVKQQEQLVHEALYGTTEG